jgi:predicted AAA+ superfamily ATPase
MIFIALRQAHPEIHYYKTKNGREVDFVIPGGGQGRILIQVCESLTDPQTRKRETTALSEAMAELDLKTGIIVTRIEEERIATDAGIIEAIPAWRFLLDIPGLYSRSQCRG